jgi:hypothetical protein
MPSVVVSPTPPPRPKPEVFVPDPVTPIPESVRRLAALLTRTTRALDVSIRGWRMGPGILERAPKTLVLQALLHQRIYRVLGRDPALAAQVIARLPANLRPAARSTCAALSRLFA